MINFISSGFALLIFAAIAACGMAKPPHAADSFDVARAASTSTSRAADSPRLATRERRDRLKYPSRRIDAGRLRAANAMAVLRIGFAGLSTPSRD